MEARIIIIGGLPGTGKTTIANNLANAMGSVTYTKDLLEAAVVRSGLANANELKGVGYELLKTLALNCFNSGNSPILDCIAPAQRVSLYWEDLLELPIKYLECTCSNESLHQQRLESRERGIEGWYELTWQDVLGIKQQYKPFQKSRLILDSVDSLDENTIKALDYVRA